jgi:hypothetical protein
LREPQGALRIPPLRFAPVGMTRVEGWLQVGVGEWMERPAVSFPEEMVPPGRFPGRI